MGLIGGAMELVRKKRRASTKPPPPTLPDAKLATLHNELARCHTDLSVTAMRVILLMASEVKKDDQEFKPMRLRVDDYQEKLSLEGQSAYHHLHQTIRKLATTLLETENPIEGIDEFQVLKPFTRIPRKGEFVLQFNEGMRPLLLNLNRLFCQVSLDVFFRIQGSYAVRFYLVCKSLDPEKNDLNSWRMTVSELRKWLGIPEDQYVETFNLRAAVIHRAKDELDRIADLTFDYAPQMNGQRTTGWTFTVVRNRPRTAALDRRRKVPLGLPPQADPPQNQPNYDAEAKAWHQASPEQREAWAANPAFFGLKPPQGTEKPTNAFLAILRSVLGPAEQAA
jgi:hypothetical protein